MPNKWLRMSRPGPPSSTIGPRMRSQSMRLSGFNFEHETIGSGCGLRVSSITMSSERYEKHCHRRIKCDFKNH
jgi:hypothetical protein